MKLSPLLRGVLLVASLTLTAAEDFPAPFDTEKTPGGPLPAAVVAAQATLPPGFRLSVFAHEPDVRQPIAMATDARGRLWVAENYTYAENPAKVEPSLRDRIVIFEDTDNDGVHDRRTVFWSGAQNLMSLEPGHGGVWALSLPHLVFIPDRDGDDVPDGPPQVALDGFADFKAGRHTVANGLRWGPDGWLYGRQGILAKSLVGAPGAATAERTPVNVGIWRYHPTRRHFETVAVGTTNPWGMDWDAHGEAFFTNTVIGHLWHVIPGAHYRRMSGADLEPRIYDVIEQHAAHVHWATGEVWTDVRKGVTNATLAAGGGHAHTGALIYQGGQWPAEWNGKLLTINLHGRRLNVERLERTGSGFTGRREPDAFLFHDPWFRGLDVIPAPDGGVFLSDWSDAGECHENDGVHRSSGRIYKISYGTTPAARPPDLASLDGRALVQLQLSPNDWLARHARRVLAGRAGAGRDQGDVVSALRQLLAPTHPAVHRLRALWALHLLGVADVSLLTDLLGDANEHLRAWAIRLLTDHLPLHANVFTPVAATSAVTPALLDTFARLAREDRSALVRLTLASTLQRLPLPQRLPVLGPLLGRAEDAGDHNLPLLLWCALLPLAEVRDDGFVRLIAAARIPIVQRYGARRLAEEITTAPQPLNTLLVTIATHGAPANHRALLEGLADGLSGQRKAPKPADWERVQTLLAAGADGPLLDRLRDLSALFGDGRALEQIRAAALNPANSLAQRRAALQSLIEAQGPGLRETCEQLLRVRELSVTAAGGLARFDDPALADLILREWPSLDGPERNPILNLLISRRAWAAKVIEAVAAGRIEASRFGAYQIRQIRNFKDPALDRQLDALRGAPARGTARDPAPDLTAWKARFSPATLAQADRASGRRVFESACAGCHQLNGTGGTLGPNLSGAARDNIDYLLENILTPNATVADEYRLVTLTLKDGRTLAGFVRGRTSQTVRVQTLTDLVTVATDEVVKEEQSSGSLMPAGLLEALDAPQARDLIAYLMTK
ncbi:MAG: c-type cytochrome [Opitutaceae bacterium]|nr:c-type cytochrome [Opitutaceae bacterium]